MYRTNGPGLSNCLSTAKQRVCWQKIMQIFFIETNNLRKPVYEIFSLPSASFKRACVASILALHICTKIILCSSLFSNKNNTYINITEKNINSFTCYILSRVLI